MASESVSVRIHSDTKSWLERFSLSRGSVSSTAARLIEEARRRETFRFIDFQDTSFGRLAYVQGSRIAVYFAWLTAKDYKFDAENLAKHFKWTLAKAESVLAYAERFSAEIEKDSEHHAELDEFDALKGLLPNLKTTTVKG